MPDHRRRLRMWRERGRPLWPWLPALAIAAALDLLIWLVPHVA